MVAGAAAAAAVTAAAAWATRLRRHGQRLWQRPRFWQRLRFGWAAAGGGFYGGGFYGGYGCGGCAAVPAPIVPGGGGVAYCEAHFRSYNPATGMYLGNDGRHHPCP